MMSLFGRWFGKGERGDSFVLPNGFKKESLVCSPDGTALAYAVVGGGGQHVEVNGRPEARFEVVSGITFCADSRQVAYAACSRGAWYAVFGGRRYGPHDDIGRTSPVVSPSSDRVAYTARDGRTWSAFVDGEAVGGPYEGFGAGGIAFSADSRRTVYTIRRRGAWHAVVDGVEHDPFPSMIERSHGFSPDSGAVAYIAVLAATGADGWGEAAVVVDGSPGERWRWNESRERGYGFMPEIYFSPEGKRMAYGVVQDGKSFFVVDGTAQRRYDGVVSGSQPDPGTALGLESTKASWRSGCLGFSPNGEHCAYAMFDRERRKHVLVQDGEEMALHDGITNSRVVFSPDSCRIAYCAAEGGSQFLVLDWTPLRGFYGTADIAPAFSPDSQHVAYVAMNGPSSQVLAVDSMICPLEGLTPAGAVLTWQDDTTVRLLAAEGRRVTLVKREADA